MIIHRPSRRSSTSVRRECTSAVPMSNVTTADRPCRWITTSFGTRFNGCPPRRWRSASSSGVRIARISSRPRTSSACSGIGRNAVASSASSDRRSTAAKPLNASTNESITSRGVEIVQEAVNNPRTSASERSIRLHYTLMDKVNLTQKFASFSEHFQQHIVGELNGQEVKIAKVKGEFIWHHHDDADEMFLVVKGNLTIQLRDRDVQIGEGEFFIVPRGIEHRPVAAEEAHIMLFEPANTLNTGNVRNERTYEATRA